MKTPHIPRLFLTLLLLMNKIMLLSSSHNNTVADVKINTGRNVTSSQNQTPCRTLQTTVNSSLKPPKVSLVLSLTVNITSAIFTGLTNLLVVVAINRRERLRTASNLILSSMAISDLLVGFAVQPIKVTHTLLHMLDSTSCFVKRLSSYVGFLCVSASLFNIIFFSGDRFLATVIPYRYLEHVIYNKYWAAIFSMWLLLILLAFLSFFEVLSSFILLQTMSWLVLLSFILVIASYTTIYWVVRKQRRRNNIALGQFSPGTREEKNNILDKELASCTGNAKQFNDRKTDTKTQEWIKLDAFLTPSTIIDKPALKTEESDLDKALTFQEGKTRNSTNKCKALENSGMATVHVFPNTTNSVKKITSGQLRQISLPNGLVPSNEIPCTRVGRKSSILLENISLPERLITSDVSNGSNTNHGKIEVSAMVHVRKTNIERKTKVTSVHGTSLERGQTSYMPSKHHALLQRPKTSDVSKDPNINHATIGKMEVSAMVHNTKTKLARKTKCAPVHGTSLERGLTSYMPSKHHASLQRPKTSDVSKDPNTINAIKEYQKSKDSAPIIKKPSHKSAEEICPIPLEQLASPHSQKRHISPTSLKETLQIHAFKPSINAIDFGNERSTVVRRRSALERGVSALQRNARNNTVLIIIAAYMLCFMPSTIIKVSERQQKFSPTTLVVVFDWTNTIILLNSAINPMIYCWRVAALRREMRDTLRTVFYFL